MFEVFNNKKVSLCGEKKFVVLNIKRKIAYWNHNYETTINN